MELIQQNQKFCHNCGTNLEFTFKAPQIRTESIIPKTLVKKDERPGPYSVRSLVFGILSIGIVLFAYYFGSGVMQFIFFRGIYRYFFPNYPTEVILRILMILIIIFVILHIAGVILGILSRVNSKNARKSEPVNNVEKVGSIFGILGIIGNTILLIVSIIVAIVISIFLFL